MASRLSEIKAVLLTSGVQQTNQPLWQAINQLLDYLIKAENDAAASGAGSGGSSAVASQILQLLFQELGQHDDWILIPGPRGMDGIQGLIGPPGQDGIDGEDAIPIPGPKGDIGPIGPPGMDGDCSGCEAALLGIPSDAIPAAGGTPGGADTQVQFNDGGAFGGDSGLTFNKTTDELTLAGLLDISGAAAGQIEFPATQNPSSNANTLDDCERGNWTPGIGGNGGESGQAYTTQTGRYFKVGRLVTAWGRITLSNVGTITSFVEVTGFPFSNSADVYGAGLVPYWAALTTAVIHLSIAVNLGGTRAALYATTAAATAAGTLAQADLSNTTDLIFSVTYRAD